MRTVYYTASSLDGFLATPDHSLDWLMSRDLDPAGPMNHADFMTGVGSLVMGATTYRWVLDHLEREGESWPYREPTFVLTHRDVGEPEGDVRFRTGDVRPVHAEAVAAAAGRDVWLVGGGELVGAFADAGLLDEVLVSFAPATLGAGPPLLPRRLDLVLLEVQRNRDFACGRWAVSRPEDRPRS